MTDAERLRKLVFGGVWKLTQEQERAMFTDPKTGSSFSVCANQTIGEALDELDAIWADQQPDPAWYQEQNADWEHKGESHG
jgi:hypothetical protein